MVSTGKMSAKQHAQVLIRSAESLGLSKTQISKIFALLDEMQQIKNQFAKNQPVMA